MTRKRGRHASSAKPADQVTLARTVSGHVPAGPGAPGRAAADATRVAVKPDVMHSTVSDATLPDIAAVAAFVQDDTVVRRTKYGWRVGGDDLPDLTCAM